MLPSPWVQEQDLVQGQDLVQDQDMDLAQGQNDLVQGQAQLVLRGRRSTLTDPVGKELWRARAQLATHETGLQRSILWSKG